MPALDYDRLAAFYDALVTWEGDIEFFVGQARRSGGPVLDLMAGTGRISLPLAAAGADLTCVDSSPAMLERLRGKLSRQGLEAKVVCQDAAALDLPGRFALAFIGFNSFEEIVDDAERRSVLERIFDHLDPGGLFVCTLHDPEARLRDVGPGRERTGRFTEPTSGREIEMRLETSWDPTVRLVSGRETFSDPAAGEVLLDLPIRFRLSDGDEIRILVEAAGFRVESVLGDYEGGPYLPGSSASIIFILRRPRRLRERRD